MLLFKIFFRTKVFGRENIPRGVPLIIASNHVSYADPVAIGAACPRELYFLAREDLFKPRLFGNFLKRLHTIPIKRGSRDVNALRTAIKRLSENKALVMFPEGTRSKDGNLQRPRYGIGLLASLSGAQVLTCYLKGTSEVLPYYGISVRVRAVSVYFGKRVSFNPSEFKGTRQEKYMRFAEKVMGGIAELKAIACR